MVTEVGSRRRLGEKEAEGQGASLCGFHLGTKLMFYILKKQINNGDNHKTKRTLK